MILYLLAAVGVLVVASLLLVVGVVLFMVRLFRWEEFLEPIEGWEHER